MVNGVKTDGLHVAQVVQGVLQHQCKHTEQQAMESTRRALVSASRTTSGGDSFQIVHELFALCHGEPRMNMLIKPASTGAGPIEIGVDESGRFTIKCTNLYWVYERESIDTDMEDAAPVVSLRTVLTEMISGGAGKGRGAPTRYRALSISGERENGFRPGPDQGASVFQSGDAAAVARARQEGSEFTVTLQKGAEGLGVYFHMEVGLSVQSWRHCSRSRSRSLSPLVCLLRRTLPPRWAGCPAHRTLRTL
jgi:hypothetical protein